jgi:hypothetical protein
VRLRKPGFWQNAAAALSRLLELQRPAALARTSASGNCARLRADGMSNASDDPKRAEATCGLGW